MEEKVNEKVAQSPVPTDENGCRINVFKALRELDMTEKHKEKNKLTYLPWASAWAAVKTLFPDATWDPVRSPQGNLYWSDGRTCRVETTVTIAGLTQGETLAVMDYRNQSITADKVTSVDVDKSIRRCLTKNLALFGLDLNLWIGEELSDEAKEKKDAEEAEEKAKAEVLAKEVKKVVEAGSALIKAGVPKEKMMEVVAANNAGNGNPSSIKTVDACKTILAEFKKLGEKGE